MTTLQTINAGDLPAIGQPLIGGTFFAKHFIGDQLFALAFLDKASEVSGEWGEYGELIEGANSFIDGQANTDAMIAAGSPVALKINRATGDYIPSYLEQSLLLAYYKENPGSDLTGWRWSSTQYSANLAYFMAFEGGWQGYSGKGNERPARLVRRILIIQ
ncbi:hypothetical protein EQ836_07805 [Ectopseudomonas mendocina]|uniref:DUF1566 domain-containing protein n=1 Tax=Ectopseudomonas mendocina TaxID=300 RepID=A0ABD7S0Q7_ECTME|nr:DUF1566 domain-containing protein [Pseudomonas mendocina]TRO14368.1 hypothetical protein EQ829_10200 [Pseudomonas mendocina]TRO19419.1 hypothetical protein EQ836_07805 [Pseudomonas mendocina]